MDFVELRVELIGDLKNLLTTLRSHINAIKINLLNRSDLHEQHTAETDFNSFCS